MDDIAIKVEHLSKSFRIYHEKKDSIFDYVMNIFNKKRNFEILHVLNDISFEVKKGETFGIIGRNGVGKTTLFRLLSGIYRPDSGLITVNGKLIPFLGLGAGFQGELSARDNIVMYGRILGIPKENITSSIDEILSFAELEQFADTKLKNFSSGMYARLAFSTARTTDPDILLMDEILTVGDIGFQKKCQETFRLFKEKKKSVLLVTHDLNAIQNNCDRAMFLEQGQIVSIGSPHEVILTYKNHFEKL